MRPRTLEDGQRRWIWDARQRAFVLPRPARLPKRQRRLARQQLRDDDKQTQGDA